MSKRGDNNGYNWDITFCSHIKCQNKKCDKHLLSENAKSYPSYRPMYVADFKDRCEKCNLRGDNNGND